MACMAAQAQSMKDDYKSIGVYDTWELSPFRTGELQGNVQVVENHLYSASGVNRTGHILGIQRSRFGSNTFGARVDLNSTVSIGRSGKYVHALVWVPRATKVQFIGLGRRTTNTWNEPTDVEQFWSEPVSISANTWTDIVAQVKTNENVEIHSIVVVPDCASPHALTEDFVAYVDEIVVNTSSSKRNSVTSTVDPYEGSDEPEEPEKPDPDETPYYNTNFAKNTQSTRISDGRYLKSVTLTQGSSTQRYPKSGGNTAMMQTLYLDATASAVFSVVAGQSYTPAVNWAGGDMHAYAYVDYNRDGAFTNVLAADGHSLDEESELVSYSAYASDYTGGSTGTFYNSTGTRVGNTNQTMPAFTVPSDLQSGRYRMRLKVDWCSLDAGGNDGTDGTKNEIWSNGGQIVDVILEVTGKNEVPVSSSSYRNGTIWTSDGTQITSTPLQGTYGQSYKVVMQPAAGFVSEGLLAEYMADSPNYPGLLTSTSWAVTVENSSYNEADDAFTLPAEVMYSTVSLEPMFNNAPAPQEPEPDPDLPDPAVDEDDAEAYVTNFDKATGTNNKLTDNPSSRNFLRSVRLTASDGSKQQYPSGNATSDMMAKKLYLDATAEAIFNVTAGESYTPFIDYATDWMHAYTYVDYNRDGEFTNVLESDGRSLGDGSELVSYSAYSTDYTGGATGSWYNSAGKSLGNMAQGNYSCNTMTMPAFTIPADLQSGLYRMRLKVDWCNLDAGGNDGSDGTNNQIWADGGGIVDILLNVTGVSDVPVKACSYKNGTMWHGRSQITTTALSAVYGEPYTVRMEADEDYQPDGLVAFYKTNSTTNSGMLITKKASYDTESDCYNGETSVFTLPAEVMYSEVTLRGMFEKTKVAGDVNRDGQIGIADVTALVNILLGKDDAEPHEYDHAAADVNNDGATSIADVTELVNMILGK